MNGKNGSDLYSSCSVTWTRGYEFRYDTQEILEFDRLLQAAIRLKPIHLLVSSMVSGYDDHGHVRERASAQFLQKLLAIHARHHPVEEDKIGPATSPQLMPGIETIDGEPDAVAVPFEEDAQQFADVFVVIDYQDGGSCLLHECLRRAIRL